MAKIKLADIDFGLNNKPKIDLAHDAKTLLETAFDKETGNYTDISVNKIVKNPANDYAKDDTNDEIKDLALDIKHNGLLHNIVVAPQNDGTYLLLSGERRVRAYEYLLNNEKDNRFSVIHAKVINGLNTTQQMIILDAANLHTRGGIGGETRFRKAMVRFVKNLQQAEQITEQEAKQMTVKAFDSFDKRLIDNNLTIENNLLPELLALLDKDLIPKRQAVIYARLSKDIQSEIAKAITEANEKGRGELKQTNDRLKESVNTVIELTTKLESSEREEHDINNEIESANAALKALEEMQNNGGNDTDVEIKRYELVKRIQSLSEERRRYTQTIKEAKAAIGISKNKINVKISSNDMTAVAVMVNKNLSKAIAGIKTVTSANSISCINKMNDVGKRVVAERLIQAKMKLEQAIKEIEVD